MESTNLKNAKTETPVMDPIRFQSKVQFSENLNPNVSHSTPSRISGSKSTTKSSKSALKNTKSNIQAVFSPRNRIRERRFVVVKKKKKNYRKEKKDSVSVVSEIDCKCGAKTNGNLKKCVCIAYETLRASQEEFFKNRRDSEEEIGESSQNLVEEEDDEIGISTMKRRREQVMEEARMSLPEYGKVMHLVKAFEKLTCFPLSKATNQTKDNKIKKALKWELPGMRQQQPPPMCQETETEQWSSSFSPTDLVLTAKNLGLEQPHASVSSSWDNR